MADRSAWGEGSAPFYSIVQAQVVPSPLPEGPRYERIGTLGRGSMGTVALGWDRWLQRQVALKIPDEQGGSSAEELLRREARIAARLDHPAIAAVYDIVENPDGRPFFVMHLVRGEPIHRLVDRGEGAPAIRAVRQAVEAIAHAHEMGLVHRDLSPSNLLVGELGRATVIDWGFAAEVGDLEAPRRVGTPGFASPEQIAGAPPDPRADVWSLGALLRYSASKLRSPEIDAICARATARQPEDRYPTALELHSDLLAWEEGRLVSAHAYPKSELLIRALWRWRLPLGVGLLALVVLLGQAWLDASRLRQERDRAIQADARAVASLGAVLAEQAISAWKHGDHQRGYQLARQSREHGAHPDAMGVLMAERPSSLRRVASRDLPEDCHPWELTGGGHVAWCRRPGGALVAPFDGEPWSIASPIAVADARVTEGQISVLFADGKLRVFDLSSGEPSLASLEPPGYFLHDTQIWRAGRLSTELLDPGLPVPPCEQPLNALARAPEGTWWMSCLRGELWKVEPDRPPVLVRGEGSDTIFRIAATATATWASTARGALIRLDGPAQELSLGEVPRRLFPSAAQDLIVVRGGAGRTRVFDAVDGQWVLDLPLSGPITVDDRGEISSIEDGRWTRYRLPERMELLSWRVPQGLSSVAIGPEGRWVVTGDGGGYLRTFDLHGLQPPKVERWQERVVKGVAVGADGTLAAVAVDADPVRFGPLNGPLRAPDLELSLSYRRIAVWPDGGIFALRYGEGLRNLVPPSSSFDFPGIEFRDVFVEPQVGAAYLSSDAGVFRLDRRGDLAPISSEPSTYIAAFGEDFAFSQGRVVVVQSQGQRRALTAPVLVTALALTERLVLVGTLEGELRVFSREGELLARLPAHEDRLSAIAVHPDGDRTVTVGWDGQIQILRLSPLER
ncbi:MAG: hypothetical protein EA397_05545 [Deltaproteobacteria bacterium]|nr:MAG: hypothetical protein EA397_05545 [Deltaproteobacteria bacterium]